MQNAVPLAFANVSGAQDEHDVVASASWYCPGAHNEHATGPGTSLYFPSAHARHGPVWSGPVKPGLHWYTPEVTLSVEFFEMHGPPAGPEHHASQTQSVAYALAADEFELSGQRVQVALPFVGLYVPGAQFTHGPPSGPVNPLLQRQFVISPLHAGAAEFAGHIVQLALASAAYCSAGHISHVVLLPAATVGEYRPTEQFVQSALPLESLYVPEEQATHWPFDAPESGPVYPALHRQRTLSLATSSGLLLNAQQSSDSIVPEIDLYPSGHDSHDRAAVTFENVSVTHATHAAEPGVGLNEPRGQAAHAELLVSFRAYPELQVLQDRASEL